MTKNPPRARLLIVLFVALILLGVVFQIPRFTRTSHEPQPTSREPWPSGAALRSDFTRDLASVDAHPLIGTLPIARQVIAEVTRSARALGIGMQLTQKAENGDSTEFAMDLEATWNDGRGRIRIAISSPTTDTLWFGGDTEAGRLERIYWLAPDGRLEEALEMDGTLPVLLGDVMASDAVSFKYALEQGNYDVIGASGEMLVAEVTLIPADSMVARRARTAPDPHGALALIWFNDVDWQLHAIRIFNAHDRLVRIYDAFQVNGGRLASFRAESVAHKRTTVYRIGRFSVE